MDKSENDIYEKITHKLIDCLELQNFPWLLGEVKIYCEMIQTF
jgi:antirestriction protein ArdC